MGKAQKPDAFDTIFPMGSIPHGKGNLGGLKETERQKRGLVTVRSKNGTKCISTAGG